MENKQRKYPLLPKCDQCAIGIYSNGKPKTPGYRITIEEGQNEDLLKTDPDKCRFFEFCPRCGARVS